MKYQLILQWPKSSLAQYDSLIETENLLIEQLTDRSQVDGHDIGAGEANIFILTDDPEAAFGEVRAYGTISSQVYVLTSVFIHSLWRIITIRNALGSYRRL